MWLIAEQIRLYCIIIKICLFTFVFSDNQNLNREVKFANFIRLSPDAKMDTILEKIDLIKDIRNINQSFFIPEESSFHIDNTNNITIPLPSFLGKRKVDSSFYIDNIIYNGQVIKDKNYYLSYSIPKNILTTEVRKSLRPSDLPISLSPQDLYLESSLIQPEINLNSNFRFIQNTFANLKKIENINDYFFIITLDSKFYVIKKSPQSFGEINPQQPQEFDLNKFFASGLDFTKVNIIDFILDSNNKGEPREILLIDDKDNLYFFKFSCQSSKNQGNNTTVCSMEIIHQEYNRKVYDHKVLSFVNIRSTYYLALENFGIFMTNSEDSGFTKTIQQFNQNIPLKVKSMVLNDNALFIAIQDYGMKLLNISDERNPEFHTWEFQYKSLKSLCILKGLNILSILTEGDRVEGDEFFIQFSIKISEFTPILLRAHMLNRKLDIQNILIHDNFYFLFDRNSNEFLIFPIFYSEMNKEFIYKSKIEILENNDIPMPPLIAEQQLLLISKQGFYIRNISNFIQPGALIIKFNFEGEFVFRLSTFISNCWDITDTNHIDSLNGICKVLLDYTFKVSHLESTYLNQVKARFSVFVVVYILFLLFMYLVWRAYYIKERKEKSSTDGKGKYQRNIEEKETNAYEVAQNISERKGSTEIIDKKDSE
jgi:hypothetical protein